MEPRRYELDARSERATANLRLLGAAVVAACAAWMASSSPSALGWLFVLLALLASGGWLAAGLSGRRRARRAGDYFLEAGPEGLLLADGERRLHVPWSEILAVNVDEERLTVEVTRRTGDPLVVQPRYRGIGVHELGRALDEARRGATSPPGG